jgi:glyoxylase-like metal-dependent hydrolase (beta-lactamase superfamily II)
VTEVAPGVIRMQLPIWMPGLGHVNMYGLLDDRGLAVVDPGLPGPKSWKALKQRLTTAGFKLSDIHTVIVTHSHPDHFGGAGRIKKETGAQLITHKAFTTWSLDRKGKGTLSEADAERLEQAAIDEADRYTGPSLEELPAMADEDASAMDEITADHQRQSVPWGGTTPWGGSKHPMPALSRRLMIRALRLVFAPPDPTRRVKHGAPVQLAGRTWLAIHTPGHTLDHLCLYDPENGLLLSGDHVLPSITPHISGSGQGDALHSYLATLDLVASLDGVKLGLPAHGHPFEDVPGRVDAIKEHHHERMEKLRTASLAIGPASVVDLSHEVFPERHWGVMAESETFAHLEHLRRDGAAERWDEDGTLIYRVAPAGS